MAENDVIAVFKVDVGDFKTKVEGLAKSTEQLDNSVQKVGMSWTEFMKGKMGPLMRQLGSHSAAMKKLSEDYKVYKQTGVAAGVATEKFTTNTKSAAQSIRVLSQGLGGLTGLLAIGGRLLGINTEKVSELIYASQSFIHIAKDLHHTQHLSNLTTTESTVATAAATTATKASSVAQSASLGIISLVTTAILAGVTALYYWITAADEAKGKAEMFNNAINEIKKGIENIGTETGTKLLDTFNLGLETLSPQIMEAEYQLKKAKEVLRQDDEDLEADRVKTLETAQKKLDDLLERKIILRLTKDLEMERQLTENVKKGTDAEIILRKEQLEKLKLIDVNKFRREDITHAEARIRQEAFNNQIKELDVALKEGEKERQKKADEEKKQNAEKALAEKEASLQKEFNAFVKFHDEEDAKDIEKNKARLEILSKLGKDELNLKIFALEKQRDEILKNDKFTNIERLDIEQDFQNQINKLIQENTEKQKSEHTKELLKENENRFLITKTQLEKTFTTQEKFNSILQIAELEKLKREREIKLKAGEDIIAISEQIAAKELAIKNQQISDEKKIHDERIDMEKKILDSIFKAQQESFNKKQDLANKEISDQEKNIDRQRDLADKGLANTLAFEEKRKADLERQQQIEAERQKKIKLLETFLNSLATYSKESGLKPGEALRKALLDVAMATAAMAVFAEEGGIMLRSSASPLKRRHKSGKDILIHGEEGEGVLPVRAMKIIGKRNFELLRNAGRFPIRDNVFAMPKFITEGGVAVSNAEIVKELKVVQHILKNQPKEKFDITKYGEYIRTTIEDGVTTVVKGKLSKPRYHG